MLYNSNTTPGYLILQYVQYGMQTGTQYKQGLVTWCVNGRQTVTVIAWREEEPEAECGKGLCSGIQQVEQKQEFDLFLVNGKGHREGVTGRSFSLFTTAKYPC